METHMGDTETLTWKQPHYTGRHDNKTCGDMETHIGDKETLAWKHGLITEGDITWKHTWETQEHSHGNTASSRMETDMETPLWKHGHTLMWETWKHVETRQNIAWIHGTETCSLYISCSLLFPAIVVHILPSNDLYGQLGFKNQSLPY